MELTLSKHFRDRWREHFGCEPPSPARIVTMLDQAVWLQKGRLLMEPDGTQYKLLSTYWHAGMGVVIKVDRLSNPPQAVTLITGRSRGKRRGKA